MRCDTTLGLLLLLAGFCGCSRPAQPPAEFADQISRADRIVVTNRYRAGTLTITGDEVGRVRQAVSLAKHDRNTYSAVFDWDVQFCASSNVVAAIHLQDRAFWTGGRQYSDDTGVLKAFYERLEKDWRERGNQ